MKKSTIQDSSPWLNLYIIMQIKTGKNTYILRPTADIIYLCYIKTMLISSLGSSQ